MSQWVIFNNDDAHPASVVYLRKQKDPAREVYNIKDEMLLLLTACGQ